MGRLKRNRWMIFAFATLVFGVWLMRTMVGEGYLPPELILGPIIVAVIGVLVVLPFLYISLGWLPYEVGKPLKGIRRATFTFFSWTFFSALAAGFFVGLGSLVPALPGMILLPHDDVVFLALYTMIAGLYMTVLWKPALWALRLFRMYRPH